MIEITTTATLRPELYERSLSSLVDRVKGDDFRLILNIDPVGPGKAEDVAAVGRKYTKNPIIFLPKDANFQEAQLRLWRAVEGKYFWNVEDDWEFLVDVDLQKMIETMEKYPELAILRLPRWESGPKYTRQWNKREIPFNGEFFEIPEQDRGCLGFSGMPSIIRTEFLEPMLDYLSPDRDIEKQLKGRGRCGVYLRKWRYGVWQQLNSLDAIKDIGTPWRKEHRYGKNGESKYLWTSWRKLDRLEEY